jgi:hypothetical protein
MASQPIRLTVMRAVACRIAFALVVSGCAERATEGYPGFEGRVGVLRQELRIDGHAHNLVPIRAIAVHQNGTIAINQVQDGRILFFSDSGALLGSVGRRGEGPGEFINPFLLGWNADALWVFDGILRRITFVTSSMKIAGLVSHVAAAARPAPADSGRFPAFPFAFPQAVGPDGSIYAFFGRQANQVLPEPFTDRRPLGRMNQDGVIRHVVVLLPSSEGAGITDPLGSASLPFANTAQYQVAPQAGRVGIAMATLEGPDAATFSLTITDLDGDTVVARRYRFEPEPIPTGVGDSVMEARLQQLSPSLAAAARREARVPPIYPPLDGLVVGNDRSVWIALRERNGHRPYYVVAPDGKPVGTVQLLQGSRVAAATLNTIWVMQPDEFGVQSVLRYAVEW